VCGSAGGLRSYADLDLKSNRWAGEITKLQVDVTDYVISQAETFRLSGCKAARPEKMLKQQKQINQKLNTFLLCFVPNTAFSLNG
jgi:hypothetical protein